jgi:predicted nuclease of restriction endonuclease-like (RecB) superfamily
MVCYNYILKCFVLIDLKTGRLTHQDIGYGKRDVMESAA